MSDTSQASTKKKKEPVYPVKHTNEWDPSQPDEYVKEPNIYNDQYHVIGERRDSNFMKIADKLRDDRNGFYEVDPSGYNFYQHIIRKFNQKGDKDCFMELTSMVLDDLKSNGLKQGDVSLFNKTFNGENHQRESILMCMAKEGKIYPISWLLESLVLENMNQMIDVNHTDGSGQTLLHALCSRSKAQEAFDIYCDNKEYYEFDLDIRDTEDMSIMEMFMKAGMLARSIDKRNFGFFKEAIEVAMFQIEEGEECCIPDSYSEAGEMGISFIADVVLCPDLEFLEYILNAHFYEADSLYEIIKIGDLTSELNKFCEIMGTSPIISILKNGDFRKIKLILDYITKHKTIKINLEVKDRVFRNVVHCVFENKNLSNQDFLHIFINYIKNLTLDMLVESENFNFNSLYNSATKSGHSALTLLFARMKPEHQGVKDYRLVFDHILQMTDFKKLVEEPVTINPFEKCIECGLSDYFQSILENEGHSNFFTLNTFSFISFSKGGKCIYDNDHSPIELAFRHGHPKMIQYVIDSLSEIESFMFVSNEKMISLYGILMSVHSTLTKIDVNVSENDNDSVLSCLYRQFRDKILGITAQGLQNLDKNSITVDSEGRTAEEFLKFLLTSAGKNYEHKLWSLWNEEAEGEEVEEENEFQNIVDYCLSKALDTEEKICSQWFFKRLCSWIDDLIQNNSCDVSNILEVYSNHVISSLKLMINRPECKYKNLYLENLKKEEDNEGEDDDEYESSRDNLFGICKYIPEVDMNSYIQSRCAIYRAHPKSDTSYLDIISIFESLQKWDSTLSDAQKMLAFDKYTETLNQWQLKIGYKEEMRLLCKKIVETLTLYDYKFNVYDLESPIIRCLTFLFKVLMVHKEYSCVIALQEFVKKNVNRFKEYITNLTESSEEEGEGDSGNDVERNMKTKKGCGRIVIKFLENLKVDAPLVLSEDVDLDVVLEMLKGVIGLGGFWKLGLSYNYWRTKVIREGMEIDEETKKLKKVIKMMKVIERFKECCYLSNLLQNLVCFEDDNDILKDVLEWETPLKLISTGSFPLKTCNNISGIVKNDLLYLFIIAATYKNFEACNILLRNNITYSNNNQSENRFDEHLSLEEFLKFYPTKPEILKDLVQSEQIFEILCNIAEKHWESVKRKDQKWISQLFKIEEKPIFRMDYRIKKEPQNSNDSSSEGYEGEESDDEPEVDERVLTSIRAITMKDEEIPDFNYNFFYGNTYALDSLVQTHSVAQIKHLNSLGYQIGKIISFRRK
ncbi:unnamed protein product [Moneuplotes crassus]|uniref:Uncharacterized protein n=1 Tax=Euplotes crassus TaxID=5936 RepID=A0AAD1XXX7_EUPCR|nr:unnamed protein product [Moneuplotes crassus]